VEGTRVEVGQPVATIEAMKMEATITASVAGIVRRLAVSKTQSVDAGDLILVVEAE
jgi:pyruvate carboxylase